MFESMTRPAADSSIANPGPGNLHSGAKPPGHPASVLTPRRVALAAGLIFLLLVLLLAVTAPLSKSLQPITAPSTTLLSAEGRPIARR